MGFNSGFKCLSYGFTAWCSIKVVVADCSHMHIFTTEYNIYIYGRRNEDIMGANPSRPESKGIFHCTGFHVTHSFVTIVGLYCE